MNDGSVIQVSAYSGWIIGVSWDGSADGYRCWIIDPELNVLHDGHSYQTSHSALMAGKTFVERSQ